MANTGLGLKVINANAFIGGFNQDGIKFKAISECRCDGETIDSIPRDDLNSEKLCAITEKNYSQDLNSLFLVYIYRKMRNIEILK